MMARLRVELRDAFELVLIPGLAMVLPWPICYRVFRWLAGMPFLYREQTVSASRHARSRGWASDDQTWQATRRLVTLVDHADYYLSLTRSDGWMRRWIDVQGNWPGSGQPALLCSFHWGAAMWALRHVANTDLKVHALVAPVTGAQFTGRRVLHWYARKRTAMVSHTLGQTTLDVTGSLRPVVRALRAREQVLAVVDVPADQVEASQTIDFLGATAKVPRGLFRLAVDHQVPITLFVGGLRARDGRRFLRLTQLGTYDDVTQLIHKVFAELASLIAEDPAAWHFWSEAERFFVSSDSQAGPGT